MKIGIQTWGSYGDIRPFLALAEGLQTAGHDVTLVITRVDSFHNETYHSPAGVKISTVATPVVATKPELHAIERAIFALSDPIAQTQMIIKKLFLPAEEEMYAAAERLCAESDLVIGHFFHYPLNAAAQKYDRRYVSVALVHSAIPTALQPPSGLPDLGTFFNRLTWRLVKAVLNKKIKPYSDRLRARHGIAVARDLVGEVWASNQLTLIAVSPALCKPKKDWPDYYQVCGFLNPSAKTLDGRVSPELEAFLAAGARPVYFTFGSVMAEGDTKTLALFRDAAEKAGARAIIQAADWKKHGYTPTAQCHFVDSTPHELVFGRCSVIVHHGGAGTTQAALRAGRPSIVVPHTSEQAFWGRELERIGVAHKPIARMKLTVDGLAHAIAKTLASPEIGQAAAQIGAAMGEENGVASAVRIMHERYAT